MAGKRTIQVRLTRQEYERVVSDSKRMGFVNLSDYVRSRAIGIDDRVIKKINDIYDAVSGKKK